MSMIEPRDRATVLIHFYRAMVARADTWRMRMDTTTNWAIGATAAVISFSLGTTSVPHYAVFMAPLLTACFLMLEARRLTFYHLWQQRVLLMEKGMIRGALWTGVADGSADGGPVPELTSDADFVRQLDPHLGRTAPSMSLFKAAARRLRRVYVYLFAAQWLVWVLKLANHPTPASSFDEVLGRASMGVVDGSIWFGVSLGGLAFAFIMAVAAGGTDRRPDSSAP